MLVRRAAAANVMEKRSVHKNVDLSSKVLILLSTF